MTMWTKIPEGWQIFIASCIFGLFVLIVTLSWPLIKDKFWGKHPDTFIYVIGQEKSYSISQLKKQAPVRSKITMHPVIFPEGVSTLKAPDIPLKLINWGYPPNSKLYTVVVHNKGEGIDKNIKIDIDFNQNLIIHSKVSHEERVSLIEGGNPTSSFTVIKIAELLPSERQDIEILVSGKNIRSVEAWSEKLQKISNIFIFDMIIEPDKNYK
jgi:hypothetical protein